MLDIAEAEGKRIGMTILLQVYLNPLYDTLNYSCMCSIVFSFVF